MECAARSVHGRRFVADARHGVSPQPPWALPGGIPPTTGDQNGVYRNSYALPMQDVTSGILVGQAMVGGVKCNHIAFSRPGVDFQLWIPESGAPFPRRFAVSDTGTPARLTISVLMSDWNAAPAVPDSLFTFVPPQGAKPITFMRLDDSSMSSR